MFLAMSVKDRDRLKVIPRVNLGELSVSQGAAMLHLSYRQCNRLNVAEKYKSGRPRRGSTKRSDWLGGRKSRQPGENRTFRPATTPQVKPIRLH